MDDLDEILGCDVASGLAPPFRIELVVAAGFCA
jgi:hypothetical protein